MQVCLKTGGQHARGRVHMAHDLLLDGNIQITLLMIDAAGLKDGRAQGFVLGQGRGPDEPAHETWHRVLVRYFEFLACI